MILLEYHTHFIPKITQTKREMSKYHTYLIYAVSFVTTNAMQHTSSETNVHMNKVQITQEIHMSYHILKPNSEADHQDATKREVQTQMWTSKKLSAYIGTKSCKATSERKCNALSHLD